MLERRKVVFFGTGQWTGVKGHVTVPRKKLIHVLASFSWTSIVHPSSVPMIFQNYKAWAIVSVSAKLRTTERPPSLLWIVT
jgi:hypothetical protein